MELHLAKIWVLIVDFLSFRYSLKIALEFQDHYLEKCLEMKRDEHEKRMAILNKLEKIVDSELEKRGSDFSYMNLLHDLDNA